MTPLELYDQAIQNIRDQGAPAYDCDLDKCRYRFNGLKCAAGFFIPDERYEPNFEGKSLTMLLYTHNAFVCPDPELEKDRRFELVLRYAQLAHDIAAKRNGKTSDFLESFDQCAKEKRVDLVYELSCLE